MKKTLLATLLACLSVAAHADFFTGNDLLAKLQDTTPYMKGIGMGYIIGTFDTSSSITHCPPQNVTAGQVRDVVTQSLLLNPATRHMPAESLVQQALMKEWPCSKKQGNSL